MILLLMDYLKYSWGLKLPAVFAYYSTRMILAAMTSLLLSIFVGPYFIRKLYELKIGQTIRKEDCPLLGELHEKEKRHPNNGRDPYLVFDARFSFFVDGFKACIYSHLAYNYPLSWIYWGAG